MAQTDRQTRQEPRRNDRDDDRGRDSDRDDSPAKGRLPFLKVEHLNPRGQTRATIRDVRTWTGGKFGAQLIAAVDLENGDQFDFAFRVGGQAHMRIDQQLGKSIFGWDGKRIDLRVGTFDDKKTNKRTEYVEVVE